MTNKGSFKNAKLFIPGGVNSPVRSFSSVGGCPVFFKKAKGAIITDVENKKYIDYIGSWGPMILGHSFPPVIRALKRASNFSTSFGAPSLIETSLAKLICSIIPFVEKIRMVNSGTEACMSAIRLARAYTGNEKFIKFEGCYHGHADQFLIKAGSGLSTIGVPNSPGVTKGTAKDTIIAEYNNIEDVKNKIAENKNKIAAIILEPVAGNMGCVPPKEGFLKELRSLCDSNNIVLIFDEVMTGFRVSLGGASKIYSVSPDLVCYGKIIGGGLPVGAFGGGDKIMSLLAPLGPVYQAGTLSGNPLAMTCGFTLINYLNNNQFIYDDLNSKAEYLKTEFQTILKKHKILSCINQVGSMLSVHLNISKVENYTDSCVADNVLFKKLFHGLISRGVYFAPSAFESLFISYSHNLKLLKKTVDSFNKTIKEII